MRDIYDYPVQVRFPVAWGEMDAFYHVNNVNYFRYIENARAKYFDEVGFWELQIKSGIAPVMAETKCKYLQSLSYPDNLVVGTRVSYLGKTSFVMEYLIVSEKRGVAAVGEGVLVMVDLNTSLKVMIPAEIKIAIQKLEEGSG